MTVMQAVVASVILFVAAVASAQSSGAIPPTPEQVKTWIQELGAEEFRTRDQAFQKLSKAGEAIYLPLTGALADIKDLETRRRIESLIAALSVKLSPRLSIQVRISTLSDAEMNDRRVAEACYLLTCNRMPTAGEVAEVEDKIAKSKDRKKEFMQFVQRLTEGKEYCPELGELSLRFANLRSEANKLRAENKIVLHNNSETQDLSDRLHKLLKKSNPPLSIEEQANTAFLITILRYPNSKESEVIKKLKDQQIPDLVWAVLNTREFIYGK